MRPERFMEFAVKALGQAPDVRTVEPWQDEKTRPFGLQITFTTGAQIWSAITYTAAPGERADEAEVPVEGEPPAEVPFPDLIQGGKILVKGAELYLAAALLNSGNAEIAEAYAYSHGESPNKNPGWGVKFHNGSRIHQVFEYALRAGDRPGQPFDLPEAV
ncbi:hypothetical protein AB0K71_05865 [Streptomyces syringium]|uniref:hypothetical protein n=1 Tax=Streptomyces syringium TaxID=76729 RepID=UPI00343AD695